MTPKSRIVINTVASYSRTIIQIIVVLFTSRWVLKELGITDYGIFNLIGSVLVIISFINTVISNGNARFLSIEIGKGESQGLCELFKSILCIHLLIPTLLLLVGYFVGIYCIENVLSIPSERMYASLMIFRISITTGIFTFISAPYFALFIANQNIVTLSLLNLLQTILLFICAYILRFVNGDKLIIYSCLYSLTNIVLSLSYITAAYYKYECCRMILGSKIQRDKIVSILKYSFWNLFGDLGHLVRTQGIAIVVNMFFGPNGNAALGFANQLSMQACNLTNALSSATSPEVNRRFGKGDKDSAYRLSLFTSKIGVLLMLILSVPLVFNMDAVLELWLQTVPPFTGALCICLIIMFLIEKYSLGESIYLRAINRIAFPQSVVFVSYSLSVVLPYCGLIQNFGIIGVGISCIITMILSRLGFVIEMKKSISYSIKNLLYQLIIPSLSILFSALCLSSILDSKASFSISFIVITSVILVIITMAFFFYLAFNKNEKQIIISAVSKILKNEEN